MNVFLTLLVPSIVLLILASPASADELLPLPSTPDYGARALSEDYPPRLPPINMAMSTVDAAPGEVVTAVMAGCTPGETVIFELAGVSVTQFCDAAGNASARLTMPRTPGSYTVTAKGSISGAQVSESVLVSVSPVLSPALPLPASGGNSIGQFIGIAVGILMGGLGLGLVALRRHQYRPSRTGA